MKQALYAELRDALCPALPSGERRMVGMAELSEVARSTQPAVPYDTLLSIYNQLHQAQVQALDGAMKAGARSWLREYEGGASMAAIALREGFSPCNLARVLLKLLLELPEGKQGAKDVTAFLRRPSLLPCQRLADGVAACVAADWQNSPRAEVIKRTVGLEYEYVLAERLRNAGLAFSTEDSLRDEGKAVTPDVKLLVPIALDGHIVHWIDSKAMFGSEEVHAKYTAEQYQRYVNRYGDGLVIYWFDFVDQLNWAPAAAEHSGEGPEAEATVAHRGVYCSRDFPQTFVLPT